MTIRLRPHHLLCLLTYVGKGYSAAFTANLDRVAARLAAGEMLELVRGPDDICAPLLPAACMPSAAGRPAPAGPGPHCLGASVEARDAQALQALQQHLPQRPSPGSRLVLDVATLQELRALFAAGSIRQACAGCEWQDLCTSVAASGYVGVRLPSATAPLPSA